MRHKKLKVKNVYEKLQEAWRLLQKEGIKKSEFNSSAHYRYHELSDFMSNIRKILTKVGLVDIFNLHQDKAELRTVSIDNPSETIVYFHTRAEKKLFSIQAIEKELRYLKKCLYQNALGVKVYTKFQVLRMTGQYKKFFP